MLSNGEAVSGEFHCKVTWIAHHYFASMFCIHEIGPSKVHAPAEATKEATIFTVFAKLSPSLFSPSLRSPYFLPERVS